MTDSIRLRRLSTAEVRRIILSARATPPREPNLSELFSVLVYRADQNPLPELEENPDSSRSSWGQDFRTYHTLFTIPRLLPMLRACQQGKAPPGVRCALQSELNRTIAGVFVLAIGEWERVGGWLKKRIVECFDPLATERLFRSYCLKNYPILQDKLGLKSLLELPLISTH